jgi:hypothetical protein
MRGSRDPALGGYQTIIAGTLKVSCEGKVKSIRDAALATNIALPMNANHQHCRIWRGEVLMTLRRKKRYSPKDEYLEKAKGLTKKDAERLMARMRGRFARRLEDNKFAAIEALALQLEFEDEQLKEWRKSVAEIRKKEKE